MPNTTDREQIAANVRAAMARRRVDQQAVADVIGKTRQAVGGKVNGRVHFRVDELQAIAELLDVPFDELIAPDPTPAAASA